MLHGDCLYQWWRVLAFPILLHGRQKPPGHRDPEEMSSVYEDGDGQMTPTDSIKTHELQLFIAFIWTLYKQKNSYNFCMIHTAIYPSLLVLAEESRTGTLKSSVAPISSGIHYDIGDGAFVPSFMLSVEDIELIHSHLPVDVHIMVAATIRIYIKTSHISISIRDCISCWV